MAGLALRRQRCLSRVAFHRMVLLEGFSLCLAGSQAERPWGTAPSSSAGFPLTRGTGRCYSQITCLKLSILLPLSARAHQVVFFQEALEKTSLPGICRLDSELVSALV